MAAQNAQKIACTAVRDSRFTPKDSTSTKASGANIATSASGPWVWTMPYWVCTTG